MNKNNKNHINESYRQANSLEKHKIKEAKSYQEKQQSLYLFKRKHEESYRSALSKLREINQEQKIRNKIVELNKKGNDFLEILNAGLNVFTGQSTKELNKNSEKKFEIFASKTMDKINDLKNIDDLSIIAAFSLAVANQARKHGFKIISNTCKKIQDKAIKRFKKLEKNKAGIEKRKKTNKSKAFSR